MYLHLQIFDGLPTQVGICDIYSRFSPKHHINIFSILYRSNHGHLVISSFITLAFCLYLVHFLRAWHIHLGLSHSTFTHLSHWQCTHTIYDLGIHLLRCPCKSECNTTHDIFQDIVTIVVLESGTHIQKRFSTFSMPPLVMSQYSNHQKQFSNLNKHCHS